jgi:rhodanese-related sulfurtransferase
MNSITTTHPKTISPGELYRKHDRGDAVEVIDVRTPAEFRAVHATIARSVPLDSLDPARVMAERSRPADEPLYVICKSGSRGQMACDRFRAAGHAHVVNVEGGTAAWEKAGLPVTRGQATISLERQVLIAVGALVVLATALGAFLHPSFLGLTAFAGAGLVFKGITDSCCMGMLLSRMPWNRVSPEAAGCPRA